jgi:hypothetical protein
MVMPYWILVTFISSKLRLKTRSLPAHEVDYIRTKIRLIEP